MKEQKTIFQTLSSVNVNDKVEKKSNLTYLSWVYAWSEVLQKYPDASYRVIKDKETELPFVTHDKLGIMCNTEVTILGKTLEMWLPVMNGANKSMKLEAYQYKTYSGIKTCEPATMFDINKTIMRCLTKNLAMFGLGLYIYAGEDLPNLITDTEIKKPKDPEVKVLVNKTMVNRLDKDETSRYQLEVGTAQYDAVLNFISDNRSKGLKFIVDKLNSRILDNVVVKKVKNKKPATSKVNTFVKDQLTILNLKGNG